MQSKTLNRSDLCTFFGPGEVHYRKVVQPSHHSATHFISPKTCTHKNMLDYYISLDAPSKLDTPTRNPPLIGDSWPVASPFDWVPLSRLLASTLDCQVFVLSLPNHGQTERLDREMSLNGMSKDIGDFVKMHNIKGSCQYSSS